MKRKRASRSGFTIVEILISIMVITIAIFGTVAAIGFGLRASDLGRTNTLAIGVNRKVVELIIGGKYPLPNTYFTGAALTTTNLTSAYGTLPWKKLYYTGAAVDNYWFKLADYGFSDLSQPDAQKFTAEAPNYELHVHIEALSTVTTSPDSRLRVITVTTRWRDKTGWKNIKTDAYN